MLEWLRKLLPHHSQGSSTERWSRNTPSVQQMFIYAAGDLVIVKLLDLCVHFSIHRLCWYNTDTAGRIRVVGERTIRRRNVLQQINHKLKILDKLYYPIKPCAKLYILFLFIMILYDNCYTSSSLEYTILIALWHTELRQGYDHHMLSGSVYWVYQCTD